MQLEQMQQTAKAHTTRAFGLLSRFLIPAGTIHAVTNVGSGNASELATYVVEKGKPLVELALSEGDSSRHPDVSTALRRGWLLTSSMAGSPPSSSKLATLSSRVNQLWF